MARGLADERLVGRHLGQHRGIDVLDVLDAVVPAHPEPVWSGVGTSG